MANIGIIGYGVVGQALGYGFNNNGNKILFYDKYKTSSSLKDVVEDSEFIFICLPTPYKNDKIDLEIIDENVKEIYKYAKNTDKIIVIKSTVTPGTTRNYSKKYKECNFCFNPEFLTEKNAVQDFLNADRTVIGADDLKVRKIVKELYEKNFPNIPIFLTDLTTAEMVKYMANCFLAMKVIFANEIFDLCEKLKINYNEVKNMVAADKRINSSHLNVTTEKGFGGKCLSKDIVALIGLFEELGVDASLLKTVWNKNLKIRKIRDWETIPFVRSI